MDTPDAVLRAGGDQTFSTSAPDEAPKEPSGCKKKYSTPSSDEEVKSIRCRNKKRATTQRPIGGKRVLVGWVGSWCSSGSLGCWCPMLAFFLAPVCAGTCRFRAPVFSLCFQSMGAKRLSGIPCYSLVCDLTSFSGLSLRVTCVAAASSWNPLSFFDRFPMTMLNSLANPLKWNCETLYSELPRGEA